ncbi:hypothetical protein ACWEP4_37315 [Streptomyces sp. NPDC004227]
MAAISPVQGQQVMYACDLLKQHLGDAATDIRGGDHHSQQQAEHREHCDARGS